MKYRLMAFLMLAESKLKSWIIKYGRRDSVELLLQSYLVSTQRPLEFSKFSVRSFGFVTLRWFVLLQAFIEGHRFFDQYELIFSALRQAAEVYVKSDSSSKTLFYGLVFMLYYLHVLHIYI